MEPVEPDVMIRQAERLAADLSDQLIPASQRLDDLLTPAECASAGAVYLTGDGDSYHAACATAMAFETIAGLACQPVSALPFLEYRAPWLRPAGGLGTLVIAVSASGGAVSDRCEGVASIITGAPVMVMTGSGPSYGTALYSAAKMIEAAGIFTAGQDLEECSHVERWAYPDDMPVFVIAPPGRSRWRAAGVASTAGELGRRVIAVTPEDDSEITHHACAVLPVSGHPREEFSVLLYHIFASYLSSHLATRFGRKPFQIGRSLPP